MLSNVRAHAPDRYGMRAGYSASGVVLNYQGGSDSYDQADARLAIDISLMVEWDLYKWLSIKAEPGWSWPIFRLFVYPGFRINFDTFNSYSDEAITVRNRYTAFWVGLIYTF